VFLQGHFVRALGKIGDKDTENEVLLLEHDVPHSKFSEAVLNCLPKLPWIITEEVRCLEMRGGAGAGVVGQDQPFISLCVSERGRE
ncbi:unnamed protein product, partial [Timema podura]|nr:unnamed protein product [Timema podura]